MSSPKLKAIYHIFDNLKMVLDNDSMKNRGENPEKQGREETTRKVVGDSSAFMSH